VIALVTGAPGAGKSYYAVRKIVQALEAGKMVATNVALADGWALRAARAHPVRRLIPPLARVRAAQYERRVFISDELDELLSVKLAGKGEGRGVMVLDEAHTWLNSRTWDADDQGRKLTKAEAVKARLQLVRFFSRHRHKGWDVYLITQDAANLDTQVRRNYEYHVKLKNLRNFKVMGVPVIPVNLFLAIWFWNDKTGTLLKRESYTLNRGIARLYDTHQYADDFDDAPAALVTLPRPA